LIKVSVITDEIGQDFERALDVALEHRVRHVELRALWDTNVADLTPEQVARAKELLDQRGMRVVAIAGPVFKCHLSEQLRGGGGDTFGHAEDASIQEHLAILERTFEMAEAFGTDLVRTFAFWRAGDPTPEIYDEIENTSGRRSGAPRPGASSWCSKTSTLALSGPRASPLKF